MRSTAVASLSGDPARTPRIQSSLCSLPAEFEVPVHRARRQCDPRGHARNALCGCSARSLSSRGSIRRHGGHFPGGCHNPLGGAVSPHYAQACRIHSAESAGDSREWRSSVRHSRKRKPAPANGRVSGCTLRKRRKWPGTDSGWVANGNPGGEFQLAWNPDRRIEPGRSSKPGLQPPGDGEHPCPSSLD